MIHPLTLITFAAFLGSGLYVFQAKEQVAKLDRELRDIRREAEAERGRSQTLSAEWARLNDQDRLRAMAASHLRHMQPMEPAQFQRAEDANRRMPQVVAFVPLPSGFQRRADAPSAPGDVLVFTAANLRPMPEPPPIIVATVGAAVATPRAAPAILATPAAPAIPVTAPNPVVMVAPAMVAPVPRPPAPRPRIEVASLPPIAGPSPAPRAQYAQGNLPTVTAPSPAPLRTALHVQQGSLLGGTASSLPPPVPFNR